MQTPEPSYLERARSLVSAHADHFSSLPSERVPVRRPVVMSRTHRAVGQPRSRQLTLPLRPTIAR